MANTQENKTKKRNTFAWILIVLGLLVIGGVLFLSLSPTIGIELPFLGQANEDTPAVTDPTQSVGTSLENALDAALQNAQNSSDNAEADPSAVDGKQFSVYAIEVAGETLSSAIAVAEDPNAWAGTPAYVYVGFKKQTTETEENPVLGVTEMLDAIDEASALWSSDEHKAVRSGETQIINCEKYVMVIGDSRYGVFASVMAEAIDDPTVLDMEDIISRLSDVKIEDNISGE